MNEFVPKIPHPHRHDCCYDSGWCGPASVLTALHRIRDDFLAGRDNSLKETFIIADHHTFGNMVHWKCTVCLDFDGSVNPEWRLIALGANGEDVNCGGMDRRLAETDEVVAEACYVLGRAEQRASDATGKATVVFREYIDAHGQSTAPFQEHGKHDGAA